ncbi:uncharacterized protein [Notothenia coriiceps]|uniref:Fibronectin type-III domain-containing protein n=1 Tax=Notothenia coriiceps TaxID=8208 RepID=A0A6I9Q6T5_9TELE|nr:PREDICTED: uncharacterized protein LOC104967978 [Notothenia coriiceps]
MGAEGEGTVSEEKHSPERAKPPRPELRNGVLRSYSISYREYDPAGRQFKRWQHLSVPATRELESVVLSNLKPSARYGVIIQAKNDAGIGPASNAPLCSTLDEVSTIKSSSTAATWITADTTSTVQSVPAATVWRGSTPGITSVPPDPPVVELKEVRDNTFSILWTPGFEGETPITGYYLESKSANASWDYIKTVIDFSPNQTDATIIEMNPSTFNIRMFAKNSLATSGASNVLTITTGEGGRQRGDVLTTISTDTHAAASVDKSKGGHLAAIAVPVVLVLLVVGMVTTWKLLRIKQKKGNLNMWLTNGALRYRGAEPLQEL